MILIHKDGSMQSTNSDFNRCLRDIKNGHVELEMTALALARMYHFSTKDVHDAVVIGEEMNKTFERLSQP